MKPTYIPIILFIVALAAVAGGAYYYSTLPVVTNPVAVEEEVYDTYNFIGNDEVSVPEAGISQEDIDTYIAAKATMDEETRSAFFANAAEAYKTLDFNDNFDWSTSTDTVSAESSEMSLDMIAALVIDDMLMLAGTSDLNQSYRMPITMEETIPAYAQQVETTFPPRYVLEVLVRDSLLLYMDSAYTAPSRTDYLDAGIAAGLYYASDVSTAEDLVLMYMHAATFNNNFISVMGDRVPLSETVDATEDPRADLVPVTVE